jgi:hypothetical protein
MFWRKLCKSRVNVVTNLIALIVGKRTRNRGGNSMVKLDLETTTPSPK